MINMKTIKSRLNTLIPYLSLLPSRSLDLRLGKKVV